MNNSKFIFKSSILLYSILFAAGVKSQNTLDVLGLSSTNQCNVAFSVRQLSTTYTGPIMRVRVKSLYYDVYPDPSSDKEISLNSPISSSISQFTDPVQSRTGSNLASLSAADAYVAIWYDQSGNGNNLYQSTANFQPNIISKSAILKKNNKPMVTWLNSITRINIIEAQAEFRKFLRLTSSISSNAQVVVVNYFDVNDEDGFLLGDNGFF
jgi:hypothetical protein